MSLEETLSPITKRKLSLTLTLYSFQLKFVRKVSKFLRSKERPVLFITVSNYCYLFSSHTSSRWAFTSSVNVFFKSVSATNYTRNNDFITLCFHRFRQSYFFFRNIFRCLFNSIQDEPFRNCSRMGAKKSPLLPLQNLPHISYNDETWHSYTLLKEDSHHLSYAEVSIFSPEISKFCYIKKYRYRVHFNA